MTNNADYKELVGKTISEIKEELESSEKYELKKVLEAEKENKDRVTLKNWLEGQIDKQKDEQEEDSGEEKTVEKPELESKVKKESNSPWKKPSTNFMLGILVGVAITALIMYSPAGAAPGAITASEASDMAGSYIENQIGSQQQVNISVASVDEERYNDLYVVNLQVSSGQGSQNIDVYVTQNSGLMFLGPLAGAQPIDLSESSPVGNLAGSVTGSN